MVGHVLAYSVDPTARFAYLGAAFVPSHTGTGLAAHAVGLFVQYLFHTLPLLQLTISECYPGLRGVLGSVDGQYGPRTREAVRRVQGIEGARIDGVYGPETKSKMRWRTIAPGPCSRIG